MSTTQSTSSSPPLLETPISRSESLTPRHGPLAPNAFEALEDEGPSPVAGSMPPMPASSLASSASRFGFETGAKTTGALSREDVVRRRRLAREGQGIDESKNEDTDDEKEPNSHDNIGAAAGGDFPNEEKGKSKDKGKGKAQSGHHRTASQSLSEARRMMSERMKSPLMGGMKLEDLRDQLETGIEKKFAPLSIPPHRRLQTAAVALWALLIPICLIVFFLCMSFPPFWFILIPYLIWTQFDTAPDYGGRPKEWARRFFMWKFFARTIPQEADLPADRPYLFGYHPHGIIGMGAFATFATEGTNFSEYFPGIKPHLLTLESNFQIPFYREILMFHGISSVAKASCANILSQGPGSAITIVVGGATESLSAHPGTADLTLKRRYGFIKMAIREGADLVPVFSFGENDIYEQLANAKGSWVYKLQKNFQKMFGFTLPLFYGRGLFNYNYGLMPFRHPIVSVVGKPIHVKKDPRPSDEHVQEMQQLYIEELMRIWDRYKDLYARGRTKELTLVE
ncbi:2-acylglycerol O-acyltransferase 2 [Kwoniella heveanensis BCC8398]|uniref:diacylglycerol O-acyltransferase n=1 Tax=Kwoniella heveanensis BCC8398 TaxID=1296120 RepID=A0A1B9GXE9_9TREE|nr:2-acylglycerol O-acyltransferase 2 [Kwoniella heveanensis BCC8398]